VVAMRTMTRRRAAACINRDVRFSVRHGGAGTRDNTQDSGEQH